MYIFHSENIYLQGLTILQCLQLTRNDRPKMYNPLNKCLNICMQSQMQNLMKGQEHIPAIHQSEKERQRKEGKH